MYDAITRRKKLIEIFFSFLPLTWLILPDWRDIKYGLLSEIKGPVSWLICVMQH